MMDEDIMTATTTEGSTRSSSVSSRPSQMITATTTEGSTRTPSVSSRPGESTESGASWLDEFRNDELRQESALLCADALSTMLVRNSHVMSECGSPDVLRERVKVALSCVFEHFCKPDALGSASADSKPQHGQIVAIAIVELIRTATAAGYLVERIMGSGLRSALEAEFDEATMAKSELCWGLGFLVQNLEEKSGGSMEIPNFPWLLTGRLRTMLARWIDDFGLERELAEADTMFGILLEAEVRRVNMTTSPTRSAALWLLQGDGESVSSCPDPVQVCVEHAKLASKFAEGVLLAFEAWNERHPSQPPPSHPGSTEDSGQVLRVPAKFGSLADLQNSWLSWKVHDQAQCNNVNSTYVHNC